MSHVARIELEIKDLEILKTACAQLGLEFVPGQRSYAWCGTYVGDWPLPDGITEADLGQCDHAIRIPGAHYGIGVVKRGERYLLLWDFYRPGGLEPMLGRGGGRLKQAYSVELIKREARNRGYRAPPKARTAGVIPAPPASREPNHAPPPNRPPGLPAPIVPHARRKDTGAPGIAEGP